MPGKVSSTDVLVTTVDQMTVEDKERALQAKLKMNLHIVVYQGPPKEVKTVGSKRSAQLDSFFHIRAQVSLGGLPQENNLLVQLM